jgi:hypothetical protein
MWTGQELDTPGTPKKRGYASDECKNIGGHLVQLSNIMFNVIKLSSCC